MACSSEYSVEMIRIEGPYDLYLAGKANTISSWLTHSMTAATSSSRGRKRPRREEEDTPPRVSLEELEQQDRAQQQPTPGRAVLNQPLAAADQQLTPALNQPQAVANQQMTPGRAVLEQPQAAVKLEGTGGKSAARHHGQSSMTDFLTIAPAAQTGLPAAQRSLQEAHSDGETLCRIARGIPPLQMHTQHTDTIVSALGVHCMDSSNELHNFSSTLLGMLLANG